MYYRSTHHIHGPMTRFGLHAFEGFFFYRVASTLVGAAAVFMQGSFVLFLYSYFEDLLQGGQGLDVVWSD